MKDRNSSGKFLEGNTPHNKGKRKEVDIEYCKKKYLKGYSCLDISKRFNVSERTIRNRFKEINFLIRKNSEHSQRIKDKIKQTLISKGIQPKERYSGEVWNKGKKLHYTTWNKGKVTGLKGWKNREFTEETINKIKIARAKQIFPLKDTKIEVKVRKFLDRLKIEYFQHKYMNIKNAYQCDFFIPSLNLVIECDGVYWHKYPTGRDIDHVRTKELLNKGFKVLRLWEFEINEMTLNEFKKRL